MEGSNDYANVMLYCSNTWYIVLCFSFLYAVISYTVDLIFCTKRSLKSQEKAKYGDCLLI